MRIFDALDMILVILCVVSYAAQAYFRVKGNSVAAIGELIALAESSGLTGKEKMDQVVSRAFERIPAPLRKVLTKERLERIAQGMFVWMRRYADTYASVTAESESDEEPEDKMKEEITNLSKNAVADLVAEMLDMSLEAMMKMAADIGVDTEGLKTKDDYAKAIVIAALTNKA